MNLLLSYPAREGIDNETIDRIVGSTNNFISERWAEKPGQSTTRKVSDQPVGALVDRWLSATLDT